MNYEPMFPKAFLNDLKAIKKKHPSEFNKIFDAVEHVIPDDPHSGDMKKLNCFNSFRYRVGKYRIVFDIDGTKIYYLAVDKRSSIYETLRKRVGRC